MNNRFVALLTVLFFLGGAGAPSHANDRPDDLDQYRLKKLEKLCHQEYTAEIAVIDHVAVRAGETYERIMKTAAATVPSVRRTGIHNKETVLSRQSGPEIRGAKPGIYELEVNVGTAGTRPRLTLNAALVVRPNTRTLLMVSDHPIPLLGLQAEDLGVIANGLYIAIIDQTRIDPWTPDICVDNNNAPSIPQSSYNE